MKTTLRIIKKIGKGIAFLILTILLLLIASFFIGRMDLGSPGMIVPELERMAITHVNVIPMDSNRVLEDKTVVIERGIITGIYDSVPPLQEATLIDGKGKYLMPGLMDAHAHIFDRSDLALNLSQGVTTVRNMMGFPMHLRWREQVNTHSYPGATMFTAGPTINSGNNTGPFHKNISSVEEAIEAVRKTKADGYDFVKIYDGLAANEFDAIMQAASEYDLQVAGHPPRKVGLEQLTTSGILSIEHAEEIFQSLLSRKHSVAKADSVAKLIAEQGIYVAPTLIIYNYIKRTMNEGQPFLDSIPQDHINPLLRFIGNKQLGDYLDSNEESKSYSIRKDAALKEILTILYKNEVPLLLSTDLGPNLTVAGHILHREIEIWKQQGISDYDILKAGTINIARALQQGDHLGTIEVGKRAHLLLTDANPLEDARVVNKLSGLVHDGYWYDAAGLKELEAVGLDKSSTFSTIGRFLEHLISK